MESRDEVKLLQGAIKQLIEEEKVKTVKGSSSDESFVAVCGGGDEDDPSPDDQRLLLSKLLSQLDALKEDDLLEEPKASADSGKANNPEVGDKSETATEARVSSPQLGKEEIIQELKKVQRQNFVTHCLLSAMLVITVAWQLSEVSLILKFKEGLSSPLKSLGRVITGMLKGRRITRQQVEKQASVTQKPILAASSLPGLKIPELHNMEFPVFDADTEEE